MKTTVTTTLSYWSPFLLFLHRMMLRNNGKNKKKKQIVQIPMENTHLYSFPTKWNGTNRNHIHIAQSIPQHISIIVSCMSSEKKEKNWLTDMEVLFCYLFRNVSVAMYFIRSATHLNAKNSICTRRKNQLWTLRIYYFSQILIYFLLQNFPFYRFLNTTDPIHFAYFSFQRFIVEFWHLIFTTMSNNREI